MVRIYYDNKLLFNCLFIAIKLKKRILTDNNISFKRIDNNLFIKYLKYLHEKTVKIIIRLFYCLFIKRKKMYINK